jgi:hypothetical protein
MEDGHVKAFSKGIKTKYRGGLLKRENQWPPCRENEPIKLKLCYSTDNILSADQKGKSSKEVSVDYADLFKVDSKPKSRKIWKILIEGDAGTGKTTFCNVISEEWADNKILCQFDLLLFFPLRQSAIASATTLSDVLKLLHSNEKIRSSVVAHLEENEGDSTLIVADGWDELSNSERRRGSFLYKLLSGEHLPLVSVVLTSRPFASASLHEVQFIDRYIKIRSFDKESIEKYVLSQCPTEDPEVADRVIEQLTSNPLLESICSVPLNCAILCYIQQIGDKPSWTSTTLTDLYKNITLNVIKRNIKKLEPESELLFSYFDSMPEHLCESWWHQCEFAFQALVKNQLVFTEESELPADTEGMLSFGLMQSTELHSVSGPGISFHFLHSTFQEFLAALHLERQPSEKKIELCDSHSKSEKFALVWRFFFGICRSKGNKYECEGEKQAIKKIMKSLRHHPDVLTQYHCAFEAQSQTIDNEVTYDAKGLNPSTACDCMAIAYVIANSQHSVPVETVDFNDCGLEDKQITSIIDALTKADNLQVKELILDENMLSGNGISILFDKGSSIFRSLKLLNLSQNPLGAAGFMRLEQVVSNGTLANLSWLYLQGSLDHELIGDVTENHLQVGVSFWKTLSIHCPKLNIVNLVESDHLENFDLEGTPLGLEGAVCIGRILSNNINNEDLYEYSGCIDLASCQLTVTPNAEESDFVGAKDEFLQLPTNAYISSLHLDKNSFTGDKIHILAGFMTLCPCLDYLYTRDCNINSADVKQLLSQQYLTKLDRWALDNNQIEDDGVEEFRHYRHSLRIESDDNGITFNDNPLSPEKFQWLKSQLGKRLSQVDTIVDEQCEVDTSSEVDEEEEEDGDAIEGEEIDDSDEEQSTPHDTSRSDPTYSPSEDLEAEEESDHNEDSSSNSDDESMTEDDPSSLDMGDESFDKDEPSSQDNIASEDESYESDSNEDSLDSDEMSSNDDAEIIPSKKVKLAATKTLHRSDLAKVKRTIWAARSKWYDLGLELGITSDDLDTIEGDYKKIDPQFRAMLKVWLRSDHATWSALADALRQRPVGYEDLANELPQE